jgi:Ser/Thr protein kinase RdoA (MazF antagonist)
LTGIVDLVRRVQALTGAAEVRALTAGHQSQAFELTFADGRRRVAKVIDAALVDATLVAVRAEAVAALAAIDPQVCGPLLVGGRNVNEIERDDGATAFVICTEFADGVAPDVGDPVAAEAMGSTLAGLHRSMARLEPRAIPRVAALQAVNSEAGDDEQLLHGDFNADNLRINGTAVRVFDFEDCGCGPRSFDVANALYMVLFTATVDGDIDRSAVFEEAFLRGYRTTSDETLDLATVDRFVDLRVDALSRWLADLSTAPIGIRTATPEWHATLRAFVSGYIPRSQQ